MRIIFLLGSWSSSPQRGLRAERNRTDLLNFWGEIQFFPLPTFSYSDSYFGFTHGDLTLPPPLPSPLSNGVTLHHVSLIYSAELNCGFNPGEICPESCRLSLRIRRNAESRTSPPCIAPRRNVAAEPKQVERQHDLRSGFLGVDVPLSYNILMLVHFGLQI